MQSPCQKLDAAKFSLTVMCNMFTLNILYNTIPPQILKRFFESFLNCKSHRQEPIPNDPPVKHKSHIISGLHVICGFSKHSRQPTNYEGSPKVSGLSLDGKYFTFSFCMESLCPYGFANMPESWVDVFATGFDCERAAERSSLKNAGPLVDLTGFLVTALSHFLLNISAGDQGWGLSSISMNLGQINGFGQALWHRRQILQY
jgi:hypothetical protein